MKEIFIANILLQKRREKGITQEQLAEFIGVSKASVSKWETGQSYPDIALLGPLAAYFNISIDELLNYQPQLDKEQIKKLYHQLSNDFAVKPYEEVLQTCRGIIKKYYVCFPLLLQMGILLLNHSNLAPSAQQPERITEAMQLFIRIETESHDVWLCKQARILQANCQLFLQKPNKVLALLGKDVLPTASTEVTQAFAYQLLGNLPKAKYVLQVSIYQHLMDLINSLKNYLLMNTDNKEHFEQILQRAQTVCQLFDLPNLHTAIQLEFELAAAQGYMQLNIPEKALDMLERYTNHCLQLPYQNMLHGDAFFDLIDDWFAQFDLGKQAPRDRKTIQESMLQALSSSIFSPLKQYAQYNDMITTLQKAIGEN